jgi:hypothetical protein
MTKTQEISRRVGEMVLALKLEEYCFINDAEEAPRAFEVGILLALIPNDVTS